jgi:uncharacterized membrane protein
MLVAEFTFFEALGALFAFMFMLMALALFVCLFIDVFQRHDISPWTKAGWVLLLFVLPLFGSLIYIVNKAVHESHERVHSMPAPRATPRAT